MPRGTLIVPPVQHFTELNITSWEHAHTLFGEFGAYVAESIPSNDLPEEVVLGDLQGFHCDSATFPPERVTERMLMVGEFLQDPSEESPRNSSKSRSLSTRKMKRMLELTDPNFSKTRAIYDGPLSAGTNYSGFVEVHVRGENGSVLSQRSSFFEPVETGSEIPATVSENSAALVASFLSGLLLLFLIISIFVCLLRKKTMKVPHDSDFSKEKQPIHVPVKTHALVEVFIRKLADKQGVLDMEFSMLPEKSGDRSTYVADLPENILKTRSQESKAYDQTRVRISSMTDAMSGNDFINANLVEHPNDRKTYICAQGPIDGTLLDFWRMIWEQGITVIAILTEIGEFGKLRSSKYWSDSGTKDIGNEFVVSVLAVRFYSDYCIRKFLVHHMMDGATEERELLQFHYLRWPEQSIPDHPSMMLRFIKRINEHHVPERGPLLIHCSTGGGRTGTFLALDTLLGDLMTTDQIDVFSCVSHLRRQRMQLVQNTKQYAFIYRTLLEYALFGDTEIEMNHLRDHYQHLKEKTNLDGKDGLALEFEKLRESLEEPKSCIVGQMESNMSKNRYNFILPYDFNRVILPTSPSRDNSSYINASRVQGYDRSLAFIVTQDPLDITIVDFWRMVMEEKCASIVMLSELGRSPTQTKCHPYWPVNSELICDYVKVKFLGENSNSFYTKRDFVITDMKTSEHHKVSHFQHKGWVGQIDYESCVSILAVIEAVQFDQPMIITNLSTFPPVLQQPIVVHCSSGGDRSSVFVTLFVLIQQLRLEERVNVLQAARLIRPQRPCLLQTATQYEFLYRAVLAYIETHQLCDMADTQL